ncbi:hypothetical protein N657DRAFT_600220 [Parathielavia appendiculata]|uniref:Transcription factor domain-containing protein n=1 Tax=Parathielavia appendiculata TaxID=2587402 RepID=A0AAN6TXL3_9PEZI|nr:hypothetical protein N657DRAFT_600220 [Parathielavia appendiculata]
MMAGSTRPGGVKFVEHDAAGLPVKRKQVHQACLPCRKRKKRCHHVEDSATAAAAQIDQDNGVATIDRGPSRRAPTNSTGSSSDRDASDAAAQLLRFFHHAIDKASRSTPRPDQTRQTSPAPPFLGDLNPEGILVEANLPPTQEPTQTDEAPDHQIGFLPPTSPQQPKDSPAQHQRTVSIDSPQVVAETPGPFFSVPRRDGTRLTIHIQDTAKLATLAQSIVVRGLADKVMPSDTEWAALRDIYLTKIHPIFPIYEKTTLTDLTKQKCLRQLIQASVCLAAATDPDARSLLTFKSPTDESAKAHIVSYDEYSREVANFINGRLAELQEGQQISLTCQIQVMALTCLYWQPADPIERFAPLTLYAKLVSLVHTHGVHLGLLARTQTEGNGKAAGARLFKCLYALDRLIGTIYARPLMFHNVDLIQDPRPDADDSPIFRLFISLILLLDQVIEMYRPHPKVSYIDMPVFERLALEAGAQYEPEILLVTLEVLYHAIGALSVRMPRNRFRTAPECDTLPGPRTQHLPPSSVNARRSYSADRILDIVRDYKLSPLPFVPYALTLSLSVAYRKWRFSQLPMFRTRGGADFKKVLPVLQSMADIWSSARINGQLGQAVMLKLDRGEILNRKRTERSAEASRASQEQTSMEPEQVAARELHKGDDRQATANPSRRNPSPAANESDTPPDAPPCSPRNPAEPTHGDGSTIADVNSSLAPSTNIRGPLPSPTTSSSSDQREGQQPQSMPLTWAATWTAGHNNNAGNSYVSTGVPLHGPGTGGTSHLHQAQPNISISAYEYPQLDDAIPLPGSVLPQAIGSNDTSPLTGLSDGSLDGFLVDDDALFRAWDPQFAQSVDFSFCSILDPGNPFAWPEYCNYSS